MILGQGSYEDLPMTQEESVAEFVEILKSEVVGKQYREQVPYSRQLAREIKKRSRQLRRYKSEHVPSVIIIGASELLWRAKRARREMFSEAIFGKD